MPSWKVYTAVRPRFLIALTEQKTKNKMVPNWWAWATSAITRASPRPMQYRVMHKKDALMMGSPQMDKQCEGRICIDRLCSGKCTVGCSDTAAIMATFGYDFPR